MQDALYAALGPEGLNWLVNLNPGGAATEGNYVQLQQSDGDIHYSLKLHENLAAVSAPVAVNLGLGATTPVEHYLILKRAFSQPVHIKYVIYGFFDDQLPRRRQLAKTYRRRRRHTAAELFAPSAHRSPRFAQRRVA